MNFYLLFIAFLYIGGCNARVVPLDFKFDKSTPADSSVTGNELFDKSPLDDVIILDHGLPDNGQSKDLDLLNSKEDNTAVLEISSRNTSNLPIDLTPKERTIDEVPSLERDESLAISDPMKEFNSTSEIQSKFGSENGSDSEDFFEAIQINGTLDEKRTEDLTFNNEASITKSSLPHLGQRSNLERQEIESKSINNKINLNETFEVKSMKIERFDVGDIDQNETVEVFNSNQSETVEVFSSNQSETVEVFNSNQNETVEVFNSNQNETVEVVNSNKNETFEAVNSDQNETFGVAKSDQKETFGLINGSNSINNFHLQALPNNTKAEIALNGKEKIIDESKSSNLISENLEVTNDPVNSDGGIFSGFEFLINSEVARNAAKAMEVFNFSDPLTDHIMEENEFHSFLPAFNAVESFSSPNQIDQETVSFLNSSEESNETRSNFTASFPSENETSIILNQTNLEEIKNDSSILLNLNNSLKEENKTDLLNLVEKLEGNTEEKMNIASEATVSEENIQGLVSNSTAVIVPKCPSPGWCIFWFLSQDACAVSDHCLGNRICCKIGCSKTCIEVESLK